MLDTAEQESELAVIGTHVSARTIRVLLAFSMVNLTFPPSPAIRPEWLVHVRTVIREQRSITGR